MPPFRYKRETILGLAGAALVGLVSSFSTPRIHPEPTAKVTTPAPLPRRKVEPPSREMRPLAQPLLAPSARAPYERPEFGSDVARSLDTRHTVDDFHQLPLESLGRTVLNNGVHEEVLDGDAVRPDPIRADRRVKFIRLTVKRARDPAEPTVCVGGLRFFWGMSRIVDPGLTLWNPHTGERTPYDGGAWSDDDQRVAVFIFSEPVDITRYQILTSKDDPKYDPVEWVLEGSRNGTFWIEMDARRDPELPLVRSIWKNYPLRRGD